MMNKQDFKNKLNKLHKEFDDYTGEFMLNKILLMADYIDSIEKKVEIQNIHIMALEEVLTQINNMELDEFALYQHNLKHKTGVNYVK